MTVRRQTLEEWFMDHQLKRIHRDGFFIPMQMDIDVSAIHDAYAEAGRKMPVVALTIKALALMGKRHSEANRTLFRTFAGTWVIDFDHVDINVPVMMQHEGRDVLSAVVVRDADTKSVQEIHDELRAARRRPLSEMPIASHFIANRNTWFYRTKLRLIHWFVWNLPWLFEGKRGGGMGVSSLLHRHQGTHMRPVARGPHVWNVGIWSCTPNDLGVQTLRLGISFDHSALSGDGFVASANTFVDILHGKHGLHELL